MGSICTPPSPPGASPPPPRPSTLGLPGQPPVRRRRRSGTTILTSGLGDEPSPAGLLAEDGEADAPLAPSPEAAKTIPPDPEPPALAPSTREQSEPRPSTPAPDCEAIVRALDQVNREVEAVRTAEHATREQIHDLEEEIARLREEQDSERLLPAERPPLPGKDRAPGNALLSILRRRFPLIWAITTALGSSDGLDTSIAISAANSKLTSLKTKLDEILATEKRLQRSRETYERRYDALCRGGAAETSPDP